MDIEEVFLIKQHVDATFVFGHKEKDIACIRLPVIIHSNDLHDAGITTTHIVKMRQEVEILQTGDR